MDGISQEEESLFNSRLTSLVLKTFSWSGAGEFKSFSINNDKRSGFGS